MKKSLFIFLVLFALVACGDASATVEQTENSTTLDVPETVEPTVNTTTLTVRGMVCGRCVNDVHWGLSALDGVTIVSLDFNSGVLVVEHDPDVTVGEIKEILILEGFGVE